MTNREKHKQKTTTNHVPVGRADACWYGHPWCQSTWPDDAVTVMSITATATTPTTSTTISTHGKRDVTMMSVY